MLLKSTSLIQSHTVYNEVLNKKVNTLCKCTVHVRIHAYTCTMYIVHFRNMFVYMFADVHIHAREHIYIIHVHIYVMYIVQLCTFKYMSMYMFVNTFMCT